MNWRELVWTWILNVVRAIARRFSAQADTSPNVSPPNVSPLNVVEEQPPVAPISPPESPEPHPPTPTPSLPPKPLLEPFCQAIQSREGFFKPGQNAKYPMGTRSWRNNNPGNIKYGPFAKNCGAIGQDEVGFAVFPSYAKGLAALETLVCNAATGKSDIYKPTDTILQFFSKYAPAEDANDPVSYANEVALKLGVPTTFQIKNLV